MLSFESETVKELKARYSEAMTKIYNPDIIIADNNESPGNNRKNVFDFEDGVRIVASRDKFDNIYLTHYSMSFNPDIFNTSTLENSQQVMKCALSHINSIRPEATIGNVMTRGGNGVVHLFYNETEALNLVIDGK